MSGSENEIVTDEAACALGTEEGLIYLRVVRVLSYLSQLLLQVADGVIGVLPGLLDLELLLGLIEALLAHLYHLASLLFPEIHLQVLYYTL